jgi:UDP-N-acetylmuramate--alanine ligase
MREKKVITVTGAHGKTTTSSLVSHLMLEAGLSPTIAVGGIFKNIGNNVKPGEGEYFVAEADESDGSFLYYRPRYSIITNIDREHLDYYRDFSVLLGAFRSFIAQTAKGGCVFCCGDDANLVRLLQGHRGRSVLFGLTRACDVRPSNIAMRELNSEFECLYFNKPIGRFRLALGGMHNISNAMAVIALAMELGVSLEVTGKALATYKGTGRRLEVKFRDGRTMLVDDYAHHPTEIRATLAALEAVPHKRLIAVFQPHRYTRTRLLLDEFGKSFASADRVIITDIYAASEKPIPGIDAGIVCGEIRRNEPAKQVEYIEKDRILERLTATLEPGDLIVTLGAGDITRISDELAEKLAKKV